MKNLFLGFIILFSATLLFSCNKKENSSSTDETLLETGDCESFLSGASITSSCLVTSISEVHSISYGTSNLTKCEYIFTRENIDEDGFIEVHLEMYRYDALNIAKLTFDTRHEVPNIQSVSSLGDEAFYSPNMIVEETNNTHGLWVRQNNVFFVITVLDDEQMDCGNIKEELIALANAALDRLVALN